MLINRSFGAICGVLCLFLASCGFGGEPAVLDLDTSLSSQATNYPVVEPSQVSTELSLGPNVPTMVTWRGSKLFLSNLQTGKHVEMRVPVIASSQGCYGAAFSASKRYLAALFNKTIVRFDLQNGSFQKLDSTLLRPYSLQQLYRIGWCQGDSTIFVLAQAEKLDITQTVLDVLTLGKPLPYRDTNITGGAWLGHADILPNGDLIMLGMEEPRRNTRSVTSIIRLPMETGGRFFYFHRLKEPIPLFPVIPASSTLERRITDVRADGSGKRLLLSFLLGRKNNVFSDTMETIVATMDPNLLSGATTDNTSWPKQVFPHRNEHIAALHPQNNVQYLTSRVMRATRQTYTEGTMASRVYAQPFRPTGVETNQLSNIILDVSIQSVKESSASNNFGINVK